MVAFADPVPYSTRVRYSMVGRTLRGPRGKPMASKDKSGRSSKTAAAHTAKEKKQAKRDKKVAKTKSTKDM